MFIKKNLQPFKTHSKMHTAFNKCAEMQYWFMGIFQEKSHVTLRIVYVLLFFCNQRQKLDCWSYISPEPSPWF